MCSLSDGQFSAGLGLPLERSAKSFGNWSKWKTMSPLCIFICHPFVFIARRINGSSDMARACTLSTQVISHHRPSIPTISPHSENQTSTLAIICFPHYIYLYTYYSEKHMQVFSAATDIFLHAPFIALSEQSLIQPFLLRNYLSCLVPGEPL